MNEFLELVSLDPRAIIELEKKVTGITEDDSHKPGMRSLAFPWKFPPEFKNVYRYGGKIDLFRKKVLFISLCRHADAWGLKSGALEFHKRAVIIMHELLGFTSEKRLITDHLTHFRRELVLPQKLMRLLSKHFGIFYFSERGKRFSVFLTEAYQGSKLIAKCPLILWKEKVQSLVGYKGGEKKIETFSDMSDNEGDGLLQSDSEKLNLELEQRETMDYEDALLSDNSDMDAGELSSVYQNS